MNIKKVLSFFFAVLFCVSLLIPSVFATDKIAIEEELSNVIDFADYPANANDTGVYLITLMEKGYNGTGFDSSSGIYVYLYNPSKKGFKSTSELNKMTFAVEWNSDGEPTRFRKYSLDLIESARDGLFIKAKVEVLPKQISYVSAAVRHYAVSEIELYEDGHYNAKSYSCGYDFAFSGSGENLKCERTSFLTIQLNVKNTSYITGDSALGGNYSNMISSVYFSVPEEIEEKYGELYQIRYEAEKNYTSPILLTSDDEVYSKLINNRGVLADESDVSFYFGRYGSGIGGSFDANYGFSHSVRDGLVSHVGRCDNELSFYTSVFKVDTLEHEKEVVSSDILFEYFSQYDLSYYTGRLENGWSADLFQSLEGKEIEELINRKRVAHLPSYDDTHDTIFNKIWDWVIQDEEDETITAKMIESVSLSDFDNLDFSRNFLVSEMDIKDFKNYVLKAEERDENTYLFRFAFDNDYYCSVGEIDGGLITIFYEGSINGVIAPVYLDFDILELGFSDDGENVTTFGVVSSPVHALPDLETEIKNGLEDIPTDTSLDEIFGRLFVFLFGVLAALFALYLFIKISGVIVPVKRQKVKIEVVQPEQKMAISVKKKKRIRSRKKRRYWHR